MCAHFTLARVVWGFAPIHSRQGRNTARQAMGKPVRRHLPRHAGCVLQNWTAYYPARNRAAAQAEHTNRMAWNAQADARGYRNPVGYNLSRKPEISTGPRHQATPAPLSPTLAGLFRGISA